MGTSDLNDLHPQKRVPPSDFEFSTVLLQTVSEAVQILVLYCPLMPNLTKVLWIILEMKYVDILTDRTSHYAFTSWTSYKWHKYWVFKWHLEITVYCADPWILSFAFTMMDSIFVVLIAVILMHFSDVLRSQADGYVRAIQWNLHYYYNGVCSWSWFYPHHYAPYISDICNFSKDLELNFDMGKPFLPFQQLLAVLPSAR